MQAQVIKWKSFLRRGNLILTTAAHSTDLSSALVFFWPKTILLAEVLSRRWSNCYQAATAQSSVCVVDRIVDVLFNRWETSIAGEESMFVLDRWRDLGCPGRKLILTLSPPQRPASNPRCNFVSSKTHRSANCLVSDETLRRHKESTLNSVGGCHFRIITLDLTLSFGLLGCLSNVIMKHHFESQNFFQLTIW